MFLRINTPLFNILRSYALGYRRVSFTTWRRSHLVFKLIRMLRKLTRLKIVIGVSLSNNYLSTYLAPRPACSIWKVTTLTSLYGSRFVFSASYLNRLYSRYCLNIFMSPSGTLGGASLLPAAGCSSLVALLS